MIENTEEVTQNGQSRETGNTGHTSQRKKTKNKKQKTLYLQLFVRGSMSY
jgi:hypothetical protein